MTALPATQLLSSAPARTRATPWVIPTLIVVALLPRVGFLARPWESDAGLYAYMGKVVAEPAKFGQLYRDFYETKPPGVALLTAGLHRAFGTHWPTWVALQAVLALAAAAALAQAARHTWGRPPGVATFAFAAVFLNFGPAAYRGFQLETLVAAFAAFAGCVAMRLLSAPGQSARALPESPPRIRSSPDVAVRALTSFALGVSAALAANLKPTGGAVLGAFAIACLLRRQFAPVAFATLGFLIPTAAVAAWTWHAGLIPEMPALWREISLYGSGTPVLPADLLLKAFTLAGLCGLTFYGARRIARPRASHNTPAPRDRTMTFLLTWLVLELLGVYLQKRMYSYHFLPLAPPLALLFGKLFATAREIRPLGLAAALAPALGLSLAWSAGDFKTLLTGPRTLPESDYLRAHARPTDRIVGDGIERLLMETNLRCGSRYAHLFYLANHDAAPAAFGDRFLSDLTTNKPEWAIFPTNWRERRERSVRDLPLYAERPARAAAYLAVTAHIQSHVETHYAPVTQIGPNTIWRRN
ncbi:MAG: hypothetical protein ACAI43_25440 [Phycisphaerae bacterium]|nr:hypothetical protein [Tepidisphaeraceae bacterium]